MSHSSACGQESVWLATIKCLDIMTNQVHLWSVILVLCSEIDPDGRLLFLPSAVVMLTSQSGPFLSALQASNHSKLIILYLPPLLGYLPGPALL